MTHAVRISLPLFAALALACSGCGTGSDLGASGTGQAGDAMPVAAGTVHVVMKSLDFNPNSVKAKVGETVTWTNDDEAPHNVTYVSGPKFASSRPKLTIGQKFSLRLTQPGTIHYFCTIHPWMKATIVVSG
jgi:amicyanin